jgi:hypothetical protein
MLERRTTTRRWKTTRRKRSDVPICIPFLAGI